MYVVNRTHQRRGTVVRLLWGSECLEALCALVGDGAEYIRELAALFAVEEGEGEGRKVLSLFEVSEEDERENTDDEHRESLLALPSL